MLIFRKKLKNLQLFKKHFLFIDQVRVFFWKKKINEAFIIFQLPKFSIISFNLDFDCLNGGECFPNTLNVPSCQCPSGFKVSLTTFNLKFLNYYIIIKFMIT